MTELSNRGRGFSRRHALTLAAGAGVGAALSAPALAAVASSAMAPGEPAPMWPTEMKQLTPNVWAFIRAGGPGIDNSSLSNAGLIAGPNNAMIIDALGPPIHAKEFQAAVRRATPKPVTRLVNTHHHRDHTNGDYLWEPAEIVMTAPMRDLVLNQGIPAKPYEARPYWQEGMSELRIAPPTTVITGDVTYYYGDTVVNVIIPGYGHTEGDIMVYLPKEKILFSGDLAFFKCMPAAYSASLSGWFKNIDRIMDMDVTTIVPGHGPVGTKKDLADMAELFRTAMVQIRQGYNKGLSPGAAAADVDMGRFTPLGNLERLPALANRLYLEWNGISPPDGDFGQAAATKEWTEIMARRKAPAARR